VDGMIGLSNLEDPARPSGGLSLFFGMTKVSSHWCKSSHRAPGEGESCANPWIGRLKKFKVVLINKVIGPSDPPQGAFLHSVFIWMSEGNNNKPYQEMPGLIYLYLPRL